MQCNAITHDVTHHGSLASSSVFCLQPIHLGNAATAKEMASLLLQRGIFVVAFSYPVVPKDKARIRCVQYRGCLY